MGNKVKGYKVGKELVNNFNDIIKTFYNEIIKYKFSDDNFKYFYEEEGKNTERKDYFKKAKGDCLPVKMSGLFIGKKLYSIKSNLDKRFLKDENQEKGDINSSNFHSESRLISHILDDIDGFKEEKEKKITFILNARPCFSCSLRLKTFNLVQLKNENLNIENILICRNDLAATEDYNLYDKNYLTEFGSSLKTLLDSGMRVFLYELNSNAKEYRGEDNRRAINSIYCLNNKPLNGGHFNIVELDYTTFNKVEENKNKENT